MLLQPRIFSTYVLIDVLNAIICTETKTLSTNPITAVIATKLWIYGKKSQVSGKEIMFKIQENISLVKVPSFCSACVCVILGASRPRRVGWRLSLRWSVRSERSLPPDKNTLSLSLSLSNSFSFFWFILFSSVLSAHAQIKSPKLHHPPLCNSVASVSGHSVVQQK